MLFFFSFPTRASAAAKPEPVAVQKVCLQLAITRLSLSRAAVLISDHINVEFSLSSVLLILFHKRQRGKENPDLTKLLCQSGFSRGTALIEQIYMYMDRKWVYSNGLQSVILDQLVQQWLSTSSMSKNPVVAQSMKLDISAGLWCALESRRSRL